MLKRYRASLRRRWTTLEGSRSGRLLGEGDPSAISVQGLPGRGALLAFHGFGGTPKEVRTVIDSALPLRLFARAPRLPGHGDSARELLQATLPDWLDAAEAALFDLGDLAGTRVVVAGLSLGSLLAAHLAARHPERVSGLIMLSTATRLRFVSPGLPLLVCERVAPFGNLFYTRKTGADIRDPEARSRHLTYDVNPVKSAIEVLRAARIVRSELGQIRCPTLVIHGRRDRVCPVSNAYQFAKSIGTKDVKVAIMPRSGHIVTVDLDRLEVAARTQEFLRRVTDPGAGLAAM
jgi:carboxylesterase